MRATVMRSKASAAQRGGHMSDAESEFFAAIGEMTPADYLACLNDEARRERRQTQRRMIAALYWRAGEYEREADYARSRGWGEAEIACRVAACETHDAAKALDGVL